MQNYEELFVKNALRILAKAEAEGHDLVILANPSNMLYATGIRSPSGIVILSNNCSWTLVTSVLDYSRMSSQAPKRYTVKVAYRGADEALEATVPKSHIVKAPLTEAAVEIVKRCEAKKPAADLGMINHSLASSLKQKIPELSDFSRHLSKIRSIKSSEEIDLITKAVEIAEEALRRTLLYIREGVSEADIAGTLYKELLSLGSWGESFPSIIAFYANTAYPHYTPGQVRLTSPGPILVDWGAVYHGYRSDSTRTFWWGKSSSTFKKHYEALLEAQEAAIDSIYAGAEAREPDTQARQILRKHGLEKYFIHGLGHGVGVDVHEEPYLRPGSKTILENNMIVTIEPGIYLDKIHGIRIEDLAVVTPSGARLLTKVTRHLIEL